MLDHEHPTRTRSPRQYRYQFTAKHHGGHGDAQWLGSLSEDDEFSIFDDADFLELTDSDGNLFGAMRDGDDSLRMLGYYQEQIAKFPYAAEGSPWHGYPVWALDSAAPANRRQKRNQPSKDVFAKMIGAVLLTERMRRRLLKGDQVLIESTKMATVRLCLTLAFRFRRGSKAATPASLPLPILICPR